MELTGKLLTELQRRLKIGNRRGVHLNAIPANSRYKFDLNRLASIDKNLPNSFLDALLTELPLKFRISWKDNVPDLNSLFEEDQSQLVKITKAFENLINQTEVIESEKGINTFGFGFPILVRRDKADNKLTVAPILIWSLRIKRTKEFNTWEILRNEEDPIYVNEVLINHLQSDIGIEIEQIPQEMLDDGLISKEELIEICSKLIRAVNTISPEDIEDTLKKKLVNIVSIGDKAHYEKLPLNPSNSFIDFGGLFSIYEVQKQNIINDYNNLMELESMRINLEDMNEHHFQSISSIETDPTQQSILHSLESTRNILIQGPPGTGKSQTLTAVLINALENNKKTIVVCEKRTALEVLHNALIEKGLNYHCVLIRDIIKDRKTVVDSVRDRVDNSEYKRYRYNYSKESLDNIINKAKNLIQSINKKHQKIGEEIFGDKNWTKIVGKLLKEQKNFNNEVNLNIDKNRFEYNTQELNTLLDLLQRGQFLYESYLPISSRSFLNSSKFMSDNPYLIEQKINEDFDFYSFQLSEVKKLHEQVSSEFYENRKSAFGRQLDRVNNIIDSISIVFQKNEQNEDLINESRINSFFYKITSLFSGIKKETISDYKKLQFLFSQLENEMQLSKDLPSIRFDGNLLTKKKEFSDCINNIEITKSQFEITIQNEFKKIDLLQSDLNEFDLKSLPRLKEKLFALEDKIKNDNWVNEKIELSEFDNFLNNVTDLIHHKKEYFNTDYDLFTIEFKWFQFYNSLSEINKSIVDELKSKSNWSKTFMVFYLNSMLVNSASLDLPTNDEEHKELDLALNSIESEQFKFIREFWFSKQIDLTREFEQRNTNLSVENLYNKRSSNRFKRLSLRQIVQYDADLFTNFFPIILTSPDVASNLFKGMNGYFDIVMFDEASQLRLEDNLPAILKGKQIVIAGDEHQMPPSSYFSKMFDGSIEDEEDIEEEEIVVDRDNMLLSCESLLDFASELNFQKKHLDFHYRSRHPFLIDFSNFAFYNQRLKPLPNNFDYTPIKYIQVNGTFSEHTNDAEAEMVLSIIDKNINRLPNGKYPSLGIATFNIAQRNLIKSKIIERQKFSKFEAFNSKIQELEENGMFIKNLENIQGDERDVIILSTTYGVSKDRKFAQRFGPINHSKGYKLLNVIITRAKYKVYCCTSIPEQVFLNYKDYLITEGSNNKRAVMYAYLAYCKAVSESNSDLRLSVLTTLAENTTKSTGFDVYRGGDLESPFEEEVYQSLADHFGTEKLIMQLPYAGFRIDIVYDPKLVGVPKIAIECDGAKYHSSNEAYLYDMHRQKILEKHGFVFHRIWSTNWWRNSTKEAAKLIEYIKKTEATSISSVKDYSSTALAFTDDIELVEDYASNNTLANFDTNSETTFLIEDNTFVEAGNASEVKLNSIVLVKYMNIDKNVSVQLVDTENNKNDKSGIQKIYYKSPLAVSLQGHSIGDIVKIGELDNFVEILKITN
ncbi:MAG: GreA/GreB family elongation factor [Bacteroidetes bacterium]|nr:GreA/GreB family elongation factor [Bacteroidota bacterium]